jgi:hypothetical protein
MAYRFVGILMNQNDKRWTEQRSTTLARAGTGPLFGRRC